MIRNVIVNTMQQKEFFNRKELKELILEYAPQYNLNNISSLIESFVQKGIVKKIDKDKYCVMSKKKAYIYQLSDELRMICDDLIREYPEIMVQVWEFSQLNEFINHLLASKTFVIEVESLYMESFFEILKEKYNHVLLKPTYENFIRYAKWGTIVVKNLVSESPNDLDMPHQIRLEKILVDLVVDKFTSKLIQANELKDIYAYCLEHYMIDQRKMLRYAKRRNASTLISCMLESKER